MRESLELLDGEPHGLARNFMFYDLNRAKASLPAEFRPKIDELMNEVDYCVGAGSWEKEVATSVDEGLEKTENADGTLKKKAVLRFHRIAGSSGWCEPLKDQGVLNAGDFDGKAADPLCKLEQVAGAEAIVID